MPKIDIPVVGGAYKHASLPFDAQTCINLYPEIGGKQSRSGSILRRTPGMVRDDGKSEQGTSKAGATDFDDLANPNMRALYTSQHRFFSGNREVMMAAVGNQVFQYTTGIDFFAPSTNAMNTINGRVSIAENNTEFIIADGTNIYTVAKDDGADDVLTINLLSVVTDAQAPDTTPMVEVIDGYCFGFNPTANAGVFAHSNLNDATAWDATDAYTAEGSSDPIIAIKGLKRNLWIFGSNSFEVWRNTGLASRTWARIPGTFTNIGCNARWSVATGFGRLFWLGGSRDGNNIVFVNEGFASRRISHHALEETINGFAVVDDAIAFCYQDAGHQFLVLTFPTGDKTFVYDLTTDEWHERAYRNTNTGEYERILPEHATFFEGRNWVSNRADASVYEYSRSTYTDAGDAMAWERTFPYLDTKKGRAFWHSLEIGMETGVGLTSGQGSDPVIQIRWSDDGGKNWSNWHEMSIGKLGEYGKRVRINRLGKSHSQGRVFQISGADPVVTNIFDNAVAEVDFGR